MIDPDHLQKVMDRPGIPKGEYDVVISTEQYLTYRQAARLVAIGEEVESSDSPIPKLGVLTIEVHRPGRYLVIRLEDE